MVSVTALITLGVVVIIIGGIAAIVIAMRQGRFDTSPRGILRGYLYALAFASFLVFLNGTASLVTAGLSSIAGRGFSYYQYQYSPPPPESPKYGSQPTPSEEQDRRFRDDLVRGIALMVTGGLLWSLHWLGIRAVDPPEVRRASTLASLYGNGLMAIAGLVTIISLPLGVYALLAYYILPASGKNASNQPGPTLAYALVFLPVLAYFLWRLVQKVGRRAAPA